MGGRARSARPHRPRGGAALLHVSRHVTVDHNPDEKRPIELLQVAQNVALGYFDLNAKVLLSIDEDRLSESERRLRARFAMCCDLAVLGVRPGAAGKEPGRHLDHDLLADEERGDGIVDELADDAPEAIVGKDLL